MSAEFETQPRGWPLPRRVLLAYGLALGAGLLLTFLGMTIGVEWEGAAWHVPPLAPVVGVLAAVELVRVARWRSTRYAIVGEGVFVRRGVLRQGVVGRVRARGAVVRAWTSGPVIEATDGELVLVGLDPSAWDEAATALRAAGAQVDPGLRPPPDPARRMGPRPGVVVAVLLALLALGSALEWRSHADRERRAVHQRLVSAVETACDAAVRRASATLAKRRQREDGHSERSSWVRAYVGQSGRWYGSVFEDDGARFVLEVDWPAPSGPDPGRRVVGTVELLRPWRVVPSATRITVRPEDDRFTAEVLAEVRRALDAASIEYEVR